MTIKAKILLLPALTAGFLVLLLAATATLGSRNVDRLQDLEAGYAPALELNRDLEGLLGEVQRTLQDAVAAEDADALARVETLRGQFAERLGRESANPVLDPARTAQLQKDFAAYAEHARATSARMIAKDARVGPELERMSADYNALKEALRQGTEESKRQSKDAFAAMRSTQRSSLLLTLALVLACVAVLGVISFRLIRGVLGPLTTLTTAAQRIANEGDLGTTIEVQSTDELGQLASAFATMVGMLREAHRGIEGAVQKLAAAAAEIYAAAQEQEAASQTQSSGAEEVNRTMQSLLESATHIADSANGVFTNAERTKETSASTAKKISELSTQTNRMVEILEVIREIADRSDLLALNASLEGTRAGEAGRGFSLVANEMRRLSERVTASVQDVKVLVTDIRSSGASTVMATEEARKLAEGTAGSARQITLVTQQQRTATEQVSKSMMDVTSVLMQSVAANRQTKRAAEDLKAQAEQLTALMSKFRVEASRK